MIKRSKFPTGFLYERWENPTGPWRISYPRNSGVLFRIGLARLRAERSDDFVETNFASKKATGAETVISFVLAHFMLRSPSNLNRESSEEGKAGGGWTVNAANQI